jgi:hypothetical protein
MQRVSALCRAAPWLRCQMAAVAALRNRIRDAEQVGAPSSRAAPHGCCCAAPAAASLLVLGLGGYWEGAGGRSAGGWASCGLVPACAAASVL